MESSREPIMIWGQSVPTSDTKAAIKEYGFFRRSFYKQKAREVPDLVPYLIDASGSIPCIIIAPGGGYQGRAPHEGAPIAKWLNSIGISAFVLNYRHAPFRFPVPFLDAQRAVRLVRFHARTYNIDPSRVGMLGFSAGGHLTSLMGTLQERNWFPTDYTKDEIDSQDDALDCMILCYPVIDIAAKGLEGCRINIMGKKPDPRLAALLTTDRQVDVNTPPAFLWTTRDDQTVPFIHSTSFAKALERNGIEHEIHVFEHGVHGLGLAENVPEVEEWTKDCESWLQTQGFAP